MDNLPIGLISLHCYNNKLTKLDNLQPGLIELNCSNNELTKLDNLPLGLLVLFCYGNPLEYDFIITLENIREYNLENK